MMREEMERAISRIAMKTLVDGYYVDSDNGEPEPSEDFCREHAEMVARISALETGVATWVSSTSMGADGHRYCQFYGCELHLDFGGLTDYGLNNALGIADNPKHPLSAHVYPSELELAARAMAQDDARWAVWCGHARRILRVNTTMAHR